MKKSKVILLVLCGVLVASPVLGLAACGATDSRAVVGVQAEGSTEVAAVNGLGSNIVSVAVRPSASDQWSDNMLEEGTTIAADQEVRLFVEGGASKCDVLVSTEAGDSLEFLDVPLDGVKKVTFLKGDDVCYVDYTTSEDTEGSTKEAALARKAQEEAEAKAKAEAEAKEEAERKAREEEERRKAEEEAAAAEAAAAAEEEVYYTEEYYPEEYYPEESYSEDYYYSDTSTSYEAPAQSQDVCAPDVVFR